MAETASQAAFTLIELLTVIAVIGIIASLTLGIVGRLKRTEYISIATAELGQIESALENYKAKYGVYPPSNANANSGAFSPALYSPLYYELTGVTNNTQKQYFGSLDNSSSILASDAQKAFGIGGFINCTKFSDEGGAAQNFLPGLKPNRTTQCTASTVNGNVQIINLVTTARGPDLNYKPLGLQDANPFRYVYPGTNNPNSYDLWVQLVISGKTNLICNWSKNPIINSPLP
jgi:prepilin-type N-terminal cleavage/methylation domain-containing protein